MRILVTRVFEQARTWCEQFRSLGLQAEALPLVGILPGADEHAMREAWANLALDDWVIFVSPTAIRMFFAERPRELKVWPEATAVAVAGPGSEAVYLQMLQDAGMAPGRVARPADDAAQLDSEHLWQAMQTTQAGRTSAGWAARRVLIVGGADEDNAFQGREWLGERLCEQGAQVVRLHAYRRGPPSLTPAQLGTLTQALREPSGCLWLFSSSLAVANLERLIHQRALPSLGAQSLALVTHPKIAERARAAGIGQVHECLPHWQAVADKIIELQSQAATS